jgi:hypothetical protein
MEIVLSRAQNQLTLFRARFHNTPTSACMGRVGQRRREVGHRMVSTNRISKFESVVKRESVHDQMVTNLIRVRNMIRTTSRWFKMTEW